MAEPANYHDIPKPSVAESVKIRAAPSVFNVGPVARYWRPPYGYNLEPPLATMARVANRLIDRETGDAYSVTELVAVVVALVLEEDIGGGIEWTETGTGSLTANINGTDYYIPAFTTDPNA